MTDEVDDFLAHHGVKGMHWGTRRSRGGYIGQVSAKKAHKEPTHPDAARAHELQKRVKKSSINVLSNEELQSFVTRINLEQQYSRLNTQTVSTGKRVSNTLLKNSGEIAANLTKQYATQYAKKGIEAALKKAASK